MLGVQIKSVVAVTGPGERQDFRTRADLTALWAYRPLSEANDHGRVHDRRVSGTAPGDFRLGCGEADVARAVRNYLLAERDHPLSWLKAGGYWIMGKGDADEKMG